MFDVPIESRAKERFTANVPSPDEPWQIGLIVGPSGSGKSTIARRAFGASVYERATWPRDRAVIDGFGNAPTKQITRLLTAVGFSSPPSWIKPYHVLSGGERFRCDLARALSLGSGNAVRAAADETKASDSESPAAAAPLVVFDEFTGVVDRTVAKIGSAAVAGAIRRGHVRCRFVAVTCHDDVLRWLAPDWVVDMATGELSWRCLRRPKIELDIHRCRPGIWPMFARHHYLSGQLCRPARCYLALWQQRPVAFAATVPLIGRRGHRRITRLVTLPDFQGVGIGTRLAEAVAQIHRDEGHRLNITASHPALIAHCQRSASWRVVQVRKSGSRGNRLGTSHYCGSPRRAVVSFEYVGRA